MKIILNNIIFNQNTVISIDPNMMFEPDLHDKFGAPLLKKTPPEVVKYCMVVYGPKGPVVAPESHLQSLKNHFEKSNRVLVKSNHPVLEIYNELVSLYGIATKVLEPKYYMGFFKIIQVPSWTNISKNKKKLFLSNDFKNSKFDKQQFMCPQLEWCNILKFLSSEERKKASNVRRKIKNIIYQKKLKDKKNLKYYQIKLKKMFNNLIDITLFNENVMNIKILTSTKSKTEKNILVQKQGNDYFVNNHSVTSTNIIKEISMVALKLCH